MKFLIRFKKASDIDPSLPYGSPEWLEAVQKEENEKRNKAEEAQAKYLEEEAKARGETPKEKPEENLDQLSQWSKMVEEMKNKNKLKETPKENEERNINREAPKQKITSYDYYDILGLTPNATDQDIQKAIKKAYARYHPDVGGHPEDFKKLVAAAETLTDPNKRWQYEQLRDLGDENLLKEFNPFSKEKDDWEDQFYRDFVGKKVGVGGTDYTMSKPPIHPEDLSHLAKASAGGLVGSVGLIAGGKMIKDKLEEREIKKYLDHLKHQKESCVDAASSDIVAAASSYGHRAKRKKRAKPGNAIY